MQRPIGPPSRDTAPGSAHASGRTEFGAPIPHERLQRLTWSTTVGVAYGAGAFLIVAIVVTEPVVPVAVVAAAGVACGSVASARLLRRRLPAASAPAEAGQDRLPVGLAVIAVAGAVAAVAAAQWAGTVMGAIVAGLATAGVAVSVPHRRRGTVIAGGALASMAIAASARHLAAGSLDLPAVADQAIIVLAVSFGLTAALWFWDLIHRQEAARRLEGELAVADERLRFAADLHDVQGHHLQVIALKSELAARLAQSDPSAAESHMNEVQAHARAALDDTREVVQGYRRAPLGAELANAARVLASAGIDGRLSQGTRDAAESVGEPGRQLLGLVVREATTNILRHSRADQARFALDMDAGWARLRVRSNGADATATAPGTGLAALAERLAGAGGGLDWAREGEWFTVTARVPSSGQERA